MSVLAYKRLITPEEFECLPDADDYAVDDKIADYFDAKIPLIWIVSPKTHSPDLRPE